MLQRFPVVHFRGAPDAYALAVVHQRDSVRKFCRQIQFVSHDHHGIAMFIGKLPQPPQQFNFATDIQMLCRLIQQK